MRQSYNNLIFLFIYLPVFLLFAEVEDVFGPGSL